MSRLQQKSGNVATSSGQGTKEGAVVERRLKSLDAYRGLIMISLAFVAFGLAETAKLHLVQQPDDANWGSVRYQLSHVEWTGCAYWDLIQPSFMFMVGVSMAYSYVRRLREGHSYVRMLGHAFTRGVVLVLLGVFLSSNWSDQTNWSFMNVLSQIGLGYVFLFLLWGRPVVVQLGVAVALLVVTWAAYVNYPEAGIDLESGAEQTGVTAEWAAEYLVNVDPAWHKNANLGHAVDRWLLNLFPRETPFEFNRGGYQTINFIPSLATMIFGLMCGELLRSDRRSLEKLLVLIFAGMAGLGVGYLLAETGICPLVKRLWTPSWAVFSTGWCCLILAALYCIVDVLGCQRWAFPLYVVGMNSIAMYMMGQLLKPWVAKTLRTHFGPDLFLMLGALWEPFCRSTLIGLVFWLICFWMYRQRIFVRV